MKSILKSKFIFATANATSQINIAQFYLSPHDGSITVVVPAPKCLLVRANETELVRIISGAEVSIIPQTFSDNYVALFDQVEKNFGWPKEWWIDEWTMDNSWKCHHTASQCIRPVSVVHYPTKQAMLEATSSTNNVKFVGDVDGGDFEYIAINFTSPQDGWSTPIAWTHQNKQQALFVPRTFEFASQMICVGAADDYATCGDVSIVTNLESLTLMAQMFAPVNVRWQSLMQPYLRRLIYIPNNSLRHTPGCNDIYVTRETLLDTRVCTKLVTNEEYALQPWFECITCGLSAGSGCCIKCADSCHQGHQLITKGFSMFFCDCPSTGQCSISRQDRSPQRALNITSALFQLD